MTTNTRAERDSLDIGELRARFRGALLRPGEEGYDDVRRVWNGAIDRKPALIARCAGADDVVEAVRFARERDLLVAVRGGGHSVAGYGVCDDGLMIDLSTMKSVRVDPEARTARVAGGALWADVDKATQPFGLATTGGVISHTGVGGLTLGGGLGHLMRAHGLTVDNLRAVDLVMADATSVRVDPEHDPELFWGLRGGGGNFGVATAFEFQLHPVGPVVLGGPVFWSADDAPAVLRLLREVIADAPDQLGVTLAMMLAPPAPFLPAGTTGTPAIGLVLVWSGDPEEGQRVVEPFRRVGTPLAELVRPVPYLAIQSSLDGGPQHGRHYYWRSHRIPEISDEVIEMLVDGVRSITSPFSQIGGWAVGGAVSRIDPGATAVGAREVGLEVNLTAGWPPPDPNPERHVAWVRELWDRLTPHSVGVYANFISDEAAGLDAAYGERLTRLVALKDRMDPTNVFRMNANIAPSVTTS